MNNPHKLSPEERGITPNQFWGKGINHQMSKERRAERQRRHRDNSSRRLQMSQNKR